MTYQTLSVSYADGVASVELARPDKLNAMSRPMWSELRRVFCEIDEAPQARVVILTGAGRHFTAGIDLAMLSELTDRGGDRCQARSREALRRTLLELQDVITGLEVCRKPVLAAIHGACIGGGIDLTCAADMRYCTADASFVIKEIDLAIAADVGTLQRLPKIVGDGIARELAYTGRPFSGREAREIGFVNRCFATREEMLTEVTEIARAIAAKSPIAIRSTKEMLLYARDHTVADSLKYMAIWNAGLMQSVDLEEAVEAARQKREPRFGD